MVVSVVDNDTMLTSASDAAGNLAMTSPIPRLKSKRVVKLFSALTIF
jgi:hypothetical protein